MDNHISDKRANNATRLAVPEENIISVEHPCLVKNIEKAIDMIGGPAAIAQAVQNDSDKVFSLSFRPQDSTSKTVIANKKSANNVLLKITVPVRTGRKRKRGSHGPWMEDVAALTTKGDASHLVNAMADNANSYKVTALSTVPSMQMWRNMPDLVYSTSHITVLQDAKNTLLSQHYPTVKQFDLPRTYGVEDTTTLPPPFWSNQNIPQNYTYRQNPSVKVTHDPVTGQHVLGNSQAPPKTYTYQIGWEDAEYPTAVMPDITPLENQTPIVQETVAALETLFEERPIWSRRALLNCLPSRLSAFNVVRFCLGYVSYALRSGPWRDTIVRLGIDPRKDPKYRVYQTIMLQLVPRSNQLALATGVGPRKTNSYKPRRQPDEVTEADGDTPQVPTSTQADIKKRLLQNRKTFQRKWTNSDDSKSHIFDGQSPLPPDGKVWQLCDFTDPQLAMLRDVPDIHIRATCEGRYFGWYENGTNAKMRVALKAKVEALAEGHPLDPELLRGFMLLPEKLGFEVDTDVASFPAISFSQQAETPLDNVQTDTSTANPGVSAGAISAYLGNNPTQQQLSWAATYRAFAKTGLGSVPASGASGKGRLTRSKPLTRKSYKSAKKDGEGEAPASAQGEALTDAGLSGAHGITQDQATNVDVNMEGGADNIDVDELDGPEVREGEEVLQSIEFNGFDMEEGDGSELGLDDGDVGIKIEEGDGQFDAYIGSATRQETHTRDPSTRDVAMD